MKAKITSKALIFIGFSFFSHLYTFAQKGHFTQFYNAPLVSNAAESGVLNKVRIGTNYRMQWQKIGSGIITQSLSLDLPVGKFGLGFLAHSNGAGQGSLQRNNFLFLVSKHIFINANTRLGLGIQAGLLHYQLTDNLQFDSQYSSQVGFDPSLDNGEKFKNSTLNKLDGGFGCILENTGYSWKPRFSISMNQLFAAKDVFSTASELQNFGIIQSSLEVRKAIGSKIEFTPYLMLSKQNQAKDVQLGSRISYALPKEQEIQLGMGLRSKDAFCSYIAYGFKSNLLGLSYDANRSNLRPASKGIGAWELSLRICFDKKKKDTNAKIDTLADSTLLAIDTVQIDSIQPEKVAIESPDSSKKTTPTDSLERPTNIVQTPLNPIDKAQDNSKAIEYSSINPNQIKNRLFVYFDHDMSILKSDYKIFLDNFVQQLGDKKEYTVLVSGHTDSDGDSMYNIYLGQSRAQEVLKYLVEQGVSVEHIRTFTYGKTNPITDNSDEQHKALNRRVEILLVVK